jgi:hypothetical protein
MTDAQKILTIEDFVEFAVKRLGINKSPELKFVTNRDWAVERHSFGQYDPSDNTLTIYINNRNMADVLRTLGHELVHHRQNELGKIQNDSGKTGSEIENEANALAGVLMRDYGRINDTIYETIIPSLKQIYEAEKSGRIQIYCDMDGVLCDFDSRFEHYYGVPPREYANQKGQKAMEEAVDKVGVVYWSKMPWLKGGQELWNKTSKYNPAILTSPGKFIHAREGKLIWIKENLNPQPREIMFANTGKKFEAIKDKTPQEIRNSMLIDDYYPNLAPWKEIGGIAIMYKSYDQVSAILDKFRLKEVVYPSSKSDANYDEEDHSLLDVEYTFKTDKNRYRVEFSSKERPREFDVSFGVDTNMFNKIDTFQMTGEGNARNILQTVAEIINKFHDQYGKEVDKIIISGTDEKRSRIYKQFIPQYLNPEVIKKTEIK